MTCRRCQFWKRRGSNWGTCWQRADKFPDAISSTFEYDTCALFQVKVHIKDAKVMPEGQATP